MNSCICAFSLKLQGAAEPLVARFQRRRPSMAPKKSGKARQLKPRISEETAKIVSNKDRVGRRSVLKRLKKLTGKKHHMNSAKASKTYALELLYNQRTGQDIMLTGADHRAYFFLMMIIRQLYAVNPALRKAKFQGYQLKVNGRFVQQCCLFGRGSDAIDAWIFQSLCHCIASMHVHSVFASEDAFHASIRVVLEMTQDGVERVHLLSFFFEFSWLFYYEHDSNRLRHLASLDAEAFAAHCFDNGYNPVSPRHGQGKGGKTWHPNLTEHLIRRQRSQYVELIMEIYKARVLTRAEATVVHAICQLPADEGRMSRMKMFKSIFVNTTAYGPFAEKNYMEIYVAHGLFANPTRQELAMVSDGPGAEHYWKVTHIERASMLKAVNEFMDELKVGADGQKALCISVVEKASGEELLYSMACLGMVPGCMNEGVMQFWSCATGRIWDTWNAFNRGKETPVDFHLLPTRTILDGIKTRLADAIRNHM